MWLVCCRAVVLGVWLASCCQARAQHVPSWLPDVEIEDYECRRELQQPLLNWAHLRQRFALLAKEALDERTLRMRQDAQLDAVQLELLEFAAVILWRFPQALNECPFGAITASIFATCMAFLEGHDRAKSPLKPPYERFLADLSQTPMVELLSRDLAVLLDLAPLHVTAATEWGTFALLHIYLPKIRAHKYQVDTSPERLRCAGAAVAGYTAERMLDMLRRHTPYASGRDIEGLKFLRGLDGLVSATMKDPREFSSVYVPACPAGSAAFAASAAMLSLMSNPSLFERFSNLAHWILRSYTAEAVSGASTWGIFHGLAKLGQFSLRSFDLVWSPEELMPMPDDRYDFDKLRSPLLRREHLARGKQHKHPVSRKIASFLLGVEDILQNSDAMVFVTAVGGMPFANYIRGFIHRAMVLGLHALVLACMDEMAFERCTQVVQGLSSSSGSDLSRRILCVAATEGHVIFIKHAFLPFLLSAAVDTVWIDFDTFILQDPTPAIVAARDSPARELPQRSRVRFGSFLFDDAADICGLSKICDPRQHWSHNVTSSSVETDLDYTGVEVLVTEHWDARCLNNGLFYVRASYRTLTFFTLFLKQIYVNPYTDNQNLFDAFLSHSTLDAAVPEARPVLRYALLDIDSKFGCAEGHMNKASPGDPDGLVTFHFWASDFRTREASGEDTQRERIVARNGVERVEKVRAGKDQLFELFFGEEAQLGYSSGVPAAGASFIEQARAPKPSWKGMCSVTAVGVEELVDERLIQGEQQLIDWQAATAVAATAEPLANDGLDASGRVPCSGTLEEWAEALRAVADADLDQAQVSALKSRLRSFDLGVLLTVRAFQPLGPQRLAQELRDVLS
ncbi:unnamed protein product [Effrenium voratum]|uniref:Nucleotide-diphospho-sugar transferase domain-containing protein n=1 Tax=Effrenium voratum TaxID=2562239 RepID=A0AA36N0J4_9DINO|nr:unnamed protein product [Effrenium voratum]CAJ1446789.1 unnamed protein product [Effrenium voratum]CAJ1461684.1 unnamed protein product [Effrenium voratum]